MTPERFLAKLRDTAPGDIAGIPERIGRARDRQRRIDSLVFRGLPLEEATRGAQRPWDAPIDTAGTRAVWEEMQSARVTIFELSPGGDSVFAIA